MRQFSRALAALLVTSALATPAFAQLAPPAPIRQMIDKNGVDLFNGWLDVNGPVLSMGQGGAQGLQYHKISRNGGWTDNVTAGLDLEGTTMTATFGGYSDTFTVSGSTYTNTQGNGSTLTLAGSIYTYTTRDGTIVQFDSTQAAATPYYSNAGRPTAIISPNGAKLTFAYQRVQYCKATKPGGLGPICTQTGYIYRPTTLTNNYGYQLTFSYDADYDYIYDSSQPDIQPDFYHWSQSTGVTATNLAVASGASTPTQTWANVTNGSNTYFQVTDPMNRVTQYRMSGYTVLGITLPGSSSEDETINYTNGRVTSVVTPAGTTNYSSADVSGVRTVTVTDPLSHVTTYQFNIAAQTLTSVTDPNSHTTSAVYDSYGRVTKITKPEGNYTTWTYDGRGNITQVDQTAKAGSGVTDIITTANFDSTCTSVAKCNKPNWTKDALGKETDYTYDSTTGNLLTVTQPAPTSGAAQPQVRFSYTSMQAYFKNSTGSIVASGQPVYMLTGTSTCQTTASCTGTSDEVKASTSYGPQTTGVGNNLLPVSVSKGDGTGALTATTAYTYDDVGNLTYVDGPLAGSGDTTRTLYNADREVIGTIGADPDGSGPLPNIAVRNTIDGRGLVKKVEQGTTVGQTDSAWSAFSSAKEVDTTYDARRRVVTKQVSSGGVNSALTQTSYNADDSVNCVAVRMNPSVYGSSPSSACTQGTAGSYGPDQITQNAYDPAGQLTQVQVAVGTSGAATERTLTYNANGTLSYLKDGENNLTAYTYDGFDRPLTVYYPNPNKGSQDSNGSDFTQLAYDANGNVTSKRNRDSTSITFSYDALNRMTHKGGSAIADIDYTYDLLGRQLTAKFSGSGLGITNTYDALGRMTSSTSTMDGTARTMSSTYDSAGNRTRLTGNIAGYTAPFTYDNLNRMTGNTGEVQIAYDSLGRRSSMSMGPAGGSTVSYGYDAVDRLTSMTHDLVGTSADQTLTFGYSPASQIVTRTASNDGYAYTDSADVNRNYTSNGLNQYTAAGSASFTYDANGNLATDGSNTFVYDAENKLVSVSGAHSATLSYDPLGRLWQISSGAATTRFIYDGNHEVVETDGSGNVLREFVWGPGADEPLVWWEGGGPRLLHADNQGSVFSIADGSGDYIAKNTYDEYGTPGSTNQGRFQYTGQAWLSEIGLYYYKARMYSPTAGRFLQTDPTGIKGGINLYGYAANNPVNGTDPAGTDAQWEWNCYGNCGPGYGNTEDWGDFNHDLLQANPGLSQGDINQIDSCVGGGGGSCMNETLDSVATSNFLNSFSDPSEPGFGNDPAHFSPLSPSDQAHMNALLGTSGFQAQSTIAWNETVSTGLEHGFFVWLQPNGSFVLSQIYTGTTDSMWGTFSTRANLYYLYGPQYWATYHTHPGDWLAVRGPSLSDLAFDRSHHSLGIIGSRWGVVSADGY